MTEATKELFSQTKGEVTMTTTTTTTNDKVALYAGRLEQLAGEVGETGRLAKRVRDLEEKLSATVSRLADEEQGIGRAAADIADLDGRAADLAGGDKGAYDRWRTQLKRRRENLASAEALVKALREVIAKAETDLVGLKAERQKALKRIYGPIAQNCSERLTAILDDLVDESDACLKATAEFYVEHGAVFGPGVGGALLPRAKSRRLKEVAVRPNGHAELLLQPPPRKR